MITQIGASGPQSTASGIARLGKTGELIVQELHGKFYEQMSRGNVFMATHPLAGVAAGASATADTLSTTATWALLNPPGSNVNLVPLMFVLDYIRVPTLAGTHWLTYSINNQLQNLATGTLVPNIPTLLGAGGGGIGRAYFGATLPVVPAQTQIMPLWNQGTGPVTVADILNPLPFTPDGMIGVAPGALISGQGLPEAAAALTNVVAWTVLWEEVPIITA
jgi:hypothetical protein